jgi:hypothetical protein
VSWPLFTTFKKREHWTEKDASLEWLHTRVHAITMPISLKCMLVLTGHCSHRVVPYTLQIYLVPTSDLYKTTQPNGDVQMTSAIHNSVRALTAFYNFLISLARPISSIGTERRTERWQSRIDPNHTKLSDVYGSKMDNRSSSWLLSRCLNGFLLAVVVTILHCRERRADKLEHLTVKNRFRHVKLIPYAFV